MMYLTTKSLTIDMTTLGYDTRYTKISRKVIKLLFFNIVILTHYYVINYILNRKLLTVSEYTFIVTLPTWSINIYLFSI